MIDIQQKLKKIIIDALDALGIYGGEIHIEHPADMTHGDFSTNVAMAVAKTEGKNPRELAGSIAEKISESIESHKDCLEKVEVAGPGFINFTLSQQYFLDVMHYLQSDPETSLSSGSFSEQKILVEHTSPNLFKPFHIGHIMNNAIGESLVRILKLSKAEISTMSYPSDISLGIGKTIWVIQNDGFEKLTSLDSEKEKLKYVGEAYAKATQLYDEDESIQKQMRALTQDLYDGVRNEAYEIFEYGKTLSLNYFITSVERLDSEIKNFIFESESGPHGKAIVEENLGSIFETSDGAVIYRGEQDNLHTRVFINKEGNPTYEAKDVGLFALKQERFPSDMYVYITDNEQSEYFKVMFHAFDKIWPGSLDKIKHLGHGRMSFKGMKMSSRKGGVPLAEEVIDSVGQVIRDRLDDKHKTNDDLVDAITIGAIKFSILRVQVGKNINFDPETSLSFEGDSGPYLQYTHARCHSLVVKAASYDIRPLGTLETYDEYAATTIKLIARYPEILAQAQANLAPHIIANYMIELARAFNSMYGVQIIVDKENKEASAMRITVVQAVATILEKCLWMLGIQAPASM